MPQTFVKTSSGWVPLQTGPPGPTALALYEQPAPPSSPVVGDVWIDTDDVPPVGAAGTVVTSLPLNPINGQECYFLADDVNGVIWRLRYRSTSASNYKWESVGGSSLSSERMQSESAAFIGAGSGAFNANDPTITVPLAGEYRCEHSASLYPTGAGAGNYGIALRIGGGSAGEFAYQYVAGNNQRANVEQKRTVTTTAGQTITQTYYGGGFSGNGDVSSRSLRVTPVRVI